MTYTLKPTGTTYGDGTAKFTLHRTDRPDTLLCAMRLPEEDMDFWNMLLNAQAEKAWEEGWAHYGTFFSPNMPEFGVNPYTIQEKEKNHHEKATHCPHSYYAPRCMCSTAGGH